MTNYDALIVLRTENNDYNVAIIEGLLAAIPSFITAATGVNDAAIQSEAHPILNTLQRFILQLWYNPDGTDSARLQAVVDNLLKTVKAMAEDINAAQAELDAG